MNGQETDSLENEATADLKEAVKLLGDWNKWLVTVETGIITALGFLLNLQKEHFTAGVLGTAVIIGAALTTLCFLAGIIFAMNLILSLPYVLSHSNVARTDLKLDQIKVIRIKGWIGNLETIGDYTGVQHNLFTIGIIIFAFTIILLPFARMH